MLLSIIFWGIASGPKHRGAYNGDSHLWFSISISLFWTPTPQHPSWPLVHWPGSSMVHPFSLRPPDTTAVVAAAAVPLSILSPAQLPCGCHWYGHRFDLNHLGCPLPVLGFVTYWHHVPRIFFFDKLIDFNIVDVLQFLAVTIFTNSYMEAPASQFLTPLGIVLSSSIAFLFSGMTGCWRFSLSISWCRHFSKEP